VGIAPVDADSRTDGRMDTAKLTGAFFEYEYLLKTCPKVFQVLPFKKKVFEILENKNIPNLLLKSIIEIYYGNKINVKLNIQLSE